MPRKTLSWPLAVVLVGVLVITLFPVFWIVMTALKPPTDWNAVPAIWVPSHPTIVNFRTLFDPDAIREYGVGGVSQAATSAVRGSLLASIVATALSILIGLFAAIGLARYGNGGRSTALIILSGRMFPPAAIAVPFVIIYSSVGLIDTYAGLIAIYVAASVTCATRAGTHLGSDAVARFYPGRIRQALTRLGAILLAPWALFVILGSKDIVLGSIRGLEAFSDTNNPGYFLIKTALWILAGLMLIQAAIDIAQPRRND